ncbi:hypothetical protein KIL84_023147 [Mauremys mutica]|uniref:Uncharacterized protein n=1 Tax=Mauremys mutica TaxID=74926 RepID=A0A9D3WS38_9SAUR|nr:hypothetical protein KIL84_023147 [Mauremys mutica]
MFSVCSNDANQVMIILGDLRSQFVSSSSRCLRSHISGTNVSHRLLFLPRLQTGMKHSFRAQQQINSSPPALLLYCFLSNVTTLPAAQGLLPTVHCSQHWGLQ